MNQNGKIFLIPMLLGETEPEKVLPRTVFEIVKETDYYIVENLKTARRFISGLKLGKNISELTFFELNKRTEEKQLSEFIEPAKQGKNIGIISEAGCPGIADPGSEIVKLAHRNNIDVVPLVGPSSILLALISSGASGQNFAFNGYIPIKEPERSAKIKFLENRAEKEQQSQIFMETPFRNSKIIEDVLKVCKPQTMFTIAANITTENEFIKSKTISEWKKNVPKIDKIPAIFIIF